MPFHRKETSVKKKKYPYWFKCSQDEIYGHTDDPHRTLTSIWTLYREWKKYVCFELKKQQFLCIEEDDNRWVTYTFKNKEINKEEFKQLLK